MNYFPLHIGDYLKDAGHLKNSQHGIYLRMMFRYYTDERAIPDEKLEDWGCAPRDKVVAVMRQFFRLVDGRWFHKRIEEELDVYRSLVSKNQANGIKGGRPPGSKGQKKPSGFPVGSQSVPSGMPVATQSQPTGNPNQEPRTKNQEEDGKPDGFLATGDKPPDGQPGLPGLPPGQERADKAEPTRRSFTASQLMAAFADAFPDSPAPEKWTPARDKTLRARLKEDEAMRDLGWWTDTFDWIRANCDFLMGKVEPRPGQKRFVLTFDWLINPTNLANIVEGKYHNELRRR